MRNSVRVWLGLAWCAPVAAIDLERPCPDTFATRQQAEAGEVASRVVAPARRPGSHYDPTLGRLDGIGFRSQAPDSEFILAPDNTGELLDTPDGGVTRWTFAGNEPVWISCHYTDTYLYLAFELPRQPMTCYSLVRPAPNLSYRAWCER